MVECLMHLDPHSIVARVESRLLDAGTAKVSQLVQSLVSAVISEELYHVLIDTDL